jgi:hypothetical protein
VRFFYDERVEEVQVKRPIPLILISALLILAVTQLVAETLTVKVRSTSLRSAPKFYAASVQALQAGDKVEKISSQDFGRGRGLGPFERRRGPKIRPHGFQPGTQNPGIRR